MSKNVRTQLNKVVGKSLNAYHQRVKPTVDDLKFKEEYQGRIIDCMVGEVDDNYIETPETDTPIVKLEHSREGVVKIPSIKGKTILVDADGNETDTPGEGCKLVSVGEDENNKLIILSKNKNLLDLSKHTNLTKAEDGYYYNNNYYKDATKVYYKLKPNTEHTIVFEGNTSKDWSVGINGNWVNINGLPNSPATFISPESGLVEVQIGASSYNNINKNTHIVGLVEGRVKLDNFIQHKSNKTEILLDEPLRSLPNGVCDEIVGNKLIRRVGLFNPKKHTNISFSKKSEQSLITFSGINNCYTAHETYTDDLMCNMFKSVPHKYYVGTYGEGVHNKNSSIYLNVENSKFPTLNINGCYALLEDKEIEILYALKEPIIEELPNGITLQGFDDTTMYIENSITPTVSYGYNALIPYKEELLNQKEEVEINTLDIENNIIPYLLDMEFNLMLMEDNE